MTRPRVPQVGDRIVYRSRTLGKLYDAQITKVHQPGRATSPVDLVAYKPDEHDEIWRDNIAFGDARGQWNWPPELAPDAAT